MQPTGALAVIPSRLQVGEPFTIKLKVLGPIRPVPCRGGFNTPKPGQGSPFNLNVERQIQFMDNALPEWKGEWVIEDDASLRGPSSTLTFSGTDQGVFPGDTRAIATFGGFSWHSPGFHFVRLTDPASGRVASTNAVYVSEAPPADRLYWGDPHWQTFFSDGIRCPEELYAFARDEAFLDFGAMADHMEAVTDRQWDYFQAVTNDYNQPGRFVTLQGQEWTNHNPAVGAPGHRNVYYRGDGGPVLRSNAPDCNTLDKLWGRLDALTNTEAIAIPHHTANVVMGVDWEQGWNPTYEKAVEIYSVWGSSEKPESAGNTRPIRACKGEKPGRHVVDALKRGYRLGFVGGGDIHDGRPGDDLHDASYPPRDYTMEPQGFTAAFAPTLTRGHVFDAMHDQRTYATTRRRIYLDVSAADGEADGHLTVRAAAEEGIREVRLVVNGEDADCLPPADDPRVVEASLAPPSLAKGEFWYTRVMTETGNMAWSSPQWG